MNATVYAIIDPAQLEDEAKFLEVTRAVLNGGAGYVQLRDRSSTSREVFERARAMAPICREADVPFIVNDRLDIALASEADGVHLGPDDVPISAARQVVGPDFIIGASAGTLERALSVEAAGADYLGVGAIFEARPSKADASAPRGVQIISEIAQKIEIPIIGIGGIDHENARSVIDAGAQGVAVIRALLKAADPEEAARRLCELIS